ncbi:MAG: MFS transporter [Kiloniellales bacterium]|nr:MFS transporter [Kiloniellales bacterium]
MSVWQARLSLGFSCLGHAYMHMLTAFFFVIVLALEAEWDQPFHELIELWTLGSLLVGLCALPAGWLADRWSAPGMMAVMFLGMGAACWLCAFAPSPDTMLLGLAALGVFAAIYHPVGIAWVVRCAEARGKALGINGIFGGIGIGAAGMITGGLIDGFGWRAAFFVPGTISVLTGLALVVCLARGWVSDLKEDRAPEPTHSRADMLRAFLILLVTMFCVGFIFHATQTAFPKVFDLRLADMLGEGTLGVGMVVTIVYFLAAGMQIIGGHLADRYPLKPIYLAGLLFQVIMLAAVASAFGLPLILAAVLSVMMSTAVLPAENMLLARFTPQRHRNLAFGIKFVLAFGVAPLAIWFVSWTKGATGEFTLLFFVLAAFSGLGFLAAALLPGEQRRPLAVPAE